MCESFDVADLGSARLLDMGCGVKLTRAFLSEALPIGEYVGVDVYREMIDYLKAHARDKRFSFHTVNTRNAMYNPTGEPLGDGTVLQLETGYFGCICLFSVFTHFASHDFSAMFKLLRGYIRPSGKMMFSLLLNEPSDGRHGFIDKITAHMVEQDIDLGAPKEPGDFVDFDPGDPLKIALYSQKHTIELFTGTGWEIESTNPENSYSAICSVSRFSSS